MRLGAADREFAVGPPFIGGPTAIRGCRSGVLVGVQRAGAAADQEQVEIAVEIAEVEGAEVQALDPDVAVAVVVMWADVVHLHVPAMFAEVVPVDAVASYQVAVGEKLYGRR